MAKYLPMDDCAGAGGDVPMMGSRLRAASIVALLITLLMSGSVLSGWVTAAGADTPVAAPPAATVDQTRLAQQISALEQQYQEASSGELDVLRGVKAAQATLDVLKGKEASLDLQVLAGQAQLVDAQGRLQIRENRLAVGQSSMTLLIGELDQARIDLRHRAVAAFIGQPTSGMVSAVLDARQGNDALLRLSYASSVIDSQAALVTRFYGLSRQADALRRDLVDFRDQARIARDAVAARLTVVTAARQKQDGLRLAAQTALQHQAELFSQLESRKTDFEAQIAALATQSDAIATQLKSLQSGQPVLTISGHGLLAVPIPGAPITSGFGPRVDPVYGDIRIHTGIDFGASTGTPIHAAADGVVVVAGVVGGYGNCTIIDHGQALATLYGHQSQLLVKAGDHVVQGQIIGLVGSTGMSTGPHLHFEVRVSGTPYDPIAFL